MGGWGAVPRALSLALVSTETVHPWEGDANETALFFQRFFALGKEPPRYPRGFAEVVEASYPSGIAWAEAWMGDWGLGCYGEGLREVGVGVGGAKERFLKTWAPLLTALGWVDTFGDSPEVAGDVW